ncbi:LysE/ArgO family amino acid transporter [Bordetella holmesii]|uniref:Translocator protein, LysE family n=2 Tax=Bordetella holmesii TaxID=35814 RepID=A0A158M7N6_9BORD|nr:LysE family transporter [Bordetella holmesii]AIT25871.1 lysE type translocator family protein [Bordetella holmesii 44057]EWM41628.1 lysE type translocator family protein [Bordetella holmesii 41130]EWM46439.1 lysE type translocator family protein [Bordetella holmesii 35009]EWM50604.1 lysE type translocator family protein [Bordetella holmesii 70147]AMD44977.1 lysine transporter LysE [Bordetella holmesii H558]
MFTLTFPPFFSAWASGTATGLGLFAVVGAQSVFILRQGVMRAHVMTVLATCALVDAVFIFGSVWGLQRLTEWVPGLTQAILWFGVAFLAWYGLQSARRAWRAGPLAQCRQAVPSRRAALLGALAFSLLNPHFWLDMVVVGSLAHGFADARLAFAVGVLTASVLWLAILGLGARLFAPVFSDARAWRLLDALIAVVMLTLAYSLARVDLGG